MGRSRSGEDERGLRISEKCSKVSETAAVRTAEPRATAAWPPPLPEAAGEAPRQPRARAGRAVAELEHVQRAGQPPEKGRPRQRFG